MTKVEQREQLVLELLQNFQRLDIKQVAQWMDISETTARRMCTKLEEDRKVIRVHGGVQLANQLPQNYSFELRETKDLYEKVAIGKYGASLIESGDRIFCDSGTTIHQFVLSLINRIKKKELYDVVLLTNSLANFNPIANFCKVILLGGEVRLPRMDVCGTIAESTLRKFHITKAFLGVDAIDMAKGFMTTDERTAQMNEIVINDAERSFVLADSSKFDKNSFISYANCRQITEVVTDWNIIKTVTKAYEETGFSLKVLDEPKYR
ncbi:MAG: DeoR/GlpR family DNA-binding transcription regulator [Sphaerochaetaceae bacterium]|nr:DeoR/GlpR family DNA-binding transcription regulator [Sphaerochaetaceae bacterium]